jgi:hypothetical protein
MVNVFNKPSSMIHYSNMAAPRTFVGKVTLSLFFVQGPCSILKKKKLSFVTSCHLSVVLVVGRLNGMC